MIRFVITIFVLIFCTTFNFQIFAQGNPGYIITPDGKTIEGTIWSSDKDIYKQILFINANGNERKYLPNEIKGFSININGRYYNYESLFIKNIGFFFFLRAFTDGNLKFLFTHYSEENKKIKKYLDVYSVKDTIYKIYYSDFQPNIEYDNWIKGGIALSGKEVLKGEVYFSSFVALGRKVTFRDTTNKIETNYKLNELDRYFTENVSYKKLNIAEPDEKAKERLLWEIIDGNPMQLYAEEVQKMTGNSVYTELKYYFKRRDFNYLLQVPSKYPVNNKETILKIKEYFKEYPLMISSILGGMLTSERAIVNMFNINYFLVNSK